MHSVRQSMCGGLARWTWVVMVCAVTGIQSLSTCIMIPDWCLIDHLYYVVSTVHWEAHWNIWNWSFWLLSAQSCSIHKWFLQDQYGCQKSSKTQQLIHFLSVSLLIWVVMSMNTVIIDPYMVVLTRIKFTLVWF